MLFGGTEDGSVVPAPFHLVVKDVVFARRLRYDDLHLKLRTTGASTTESTVTVVRMGIQQHQRKIH